MDNQIITCTSNNAKTSVAQLKTDRVPDSLQWLEIFVARNTTLRMKWGALWVELGGRMCQVCRQNSPTVETSRLALVASLSETIFFLDVFLWLKRRNKFNLFLRNICESWQQLNLSSELGREMQGGQEGLWTCVCLYSSTQCVAGTLEIVSKILQFPYKLFWSMISKEENGFSPTLEKANWGQGDLQDWLNIDAGWKEEGRKLQPPGWELWFHQ